jgi:hypothetical protein
VQKCVHIYVSAKTIPNTTVTKIGKGGMKESSGQGEFKCDIFAIL